VSHRIIFTTVCAQYTRLQHERKRVDAEVKSPSGRSITVWLRAAHSLLMHHFSSSTSKIVR